MSSRTARARGTPWDCQGFLPRKREKILRALVKETLSREQIDRPSQDIADACRTLDDEGATHEIERAQVKRGTGY
ncbi:hypothetical protein [Streptomyces sp. Root369]|uniref:hypothetical protein n=1 Tax=Streptomyces sp. Root369 TaxID=1736523 RepID=UPI001A8CAFF5|nr:hypothetical protein [Streptomyces sp. Root369]